ncbi:MAG: hypothetical protein AAFV29_15160 [Myxococcota bacterium]
MMVKADDFDPKHLVEPSKLGAACVEAMGQFTDRQVRALVRSIGRLRTAAADILVDEFSSLLPDGDESQALRPFDPRDE